ncbi:hypothetical protein D4100_22685 [Serratia inhibens]|uniref:Fimbrial adhesin MrpH C-terminal domain-containing protein n=1 Tax=Serratia inhibens TaxID=2338073 RepID=A0AA93BUM8_9GAMM|nr:hypothetical protein [Serratia inhibens]RJF53291.1 hypothetical protein D4100_22685 [Serratia inhibens]
MHRYFFHFIALISFVFVPPTRAGVNVVNVADGSTMLTGDVAGLIFKSMWVGSQTTTTSLFMDKKLWLRSQQDWHSPGFGETSMRNFVNSALAEGIPLSKRPDTTSDVTARVQICLNDAGRLIIYCFSGAATSTPPVTPTTCLATQPASIDFKTMPANDIPTAPTGTTIVVTCTKNTKVDATFVFGDGTDNNNLANGLNVKLRVGGWSGQDGFTYNANKDIPVTINVNAMLSASGRVSEGIFRTTGVVKLSYD